MTWDAVAALLSMLFVGRMPLPARAEGLRIGFYGAAMAYVFIDALRSRPNESDAAAVERRLVAIEMEQRPDPKPAVAIPVELPPVAEEDRIGGMDLLTGFSILRYLRRTGAVSDTEYEQKKADLLHRA